MTDWRRAATAALLVLGAGEVSFSGTDGSISRAVAQEPPSCMADREADAGSLVIRLASDDDRPVTRGRVILGPLSNPTCEAAWVVDDPHGQLQIDGLTPGRYRVGTEAPGYRDRGTELLVERRGTTDVRLVMSRRPMDLPEILSWIHRGDEAGSFAGRSVERVHLSGRPLAAPTLMDWLSSLPGVVVRPTAAGRQVVSVRGSRPEGVLVLLDGVPLNDPVTGVADLTSVPVAMLESATLVRGAVPGEGSGALAGLLVLRSRHPGAAGVTAGVEAGSFGRWGADAFGSMAGALGSVAATARWEEADNDFSFSNRVVPGDPRERRRNADVRAVHGSLTAAAADLPLVLRLRGDAVERGAPGRMGTAIFDQARWEERGGQVATELGDSDGPMLRAGYRRQTLLYRDGRAGEEERQRAEELRLRARLPLPAGVWAAGRLARAEATGDGLAAGATRLSGGFGLSGRLEASGVTAHSSLELDVASGAVAWSPSLTLETHPGRHWSLRGRAGQAFRLPSFGDLYFASAHRIQPNPGLRAERVTLDAEVETTWRSGGETLELGVRAFHRRTEEPIVWLASATAVWSPRNLDRLTAGGVELDARWRTGNGWRLRASGTWNRSRVGFGSNRNPAPYVPELRGLASVERAGGGRAARLEIEATGSRTTSLAATHRLDGFALLNLALRQELEVARLPLSLDVGIRNLLDAGYELVSLFPQPGRSIELRVGAGPIPPRGGERAEP